MTNPLLERDAAGNDVGRDPRTIDLDVHPACSDASSTCPGTSATTPLDLTTETGCG
jgi:hypothetical protein